MYRLCTPTTIMNYLKVDKYQKLPQSLFDRYLWLYWQIEELTYKLTHGESVRSFNTYCYKKGDKILGVAYVCWENNLAELYIDSINVEGLASLLKDILDRNFIKLHITVGSKLIADYIKDHFGIDYTDGIVKYYTTSPIDIKHEKVREMNEEDEYLIRKLSKNVWGSYRVYLNNDYKFYGFIDDDKLLSICAVLQLTAFKSEIIGVETFEEKNRLHGFSKTTCGFALNETLKSMNIVTWTTNLKNISSRGTAESLGFKPYYSFYELNYIKNS